MRIGYKMSHHKDSDNKLQISNEPPQTEFK